MENLNSFILHSLKLSHFQNCNIYFYFKIYKYLITFFIDKIRESKFHFIFKKFYSKHKLLKNCLTLDLLFLFVSFICILLHSKIFCFTHLRKFVYFYSNRLFNIKCIYTSDYIKVSFSFS